MEKLIFEKSSEGRKGYTLPVLDVPEVKIADTIPADLTRVNELRLPEVSENELSRHFIKLSKLNFNIEEGMYPLGSCTMKYNPKVNEVTASIPGFSNLHPETKPENAQGALRMLYELGEAFKTITGLRGVTLQPSAGSNGEFAGIMMMRAYHMDRKDDKRTVILMPDSAHGTNPSSAAIGGFKVQTVASRPDGRVDVQDLRSKADETIAGFMITNPNTIGLFEEDIMEIGEIIHGCGGLMYMDGANMNALLGITTPGKMNFDCIHINVHKTFSTPHGGGGPGAAPVCVSDKLVPYLPSPSVVKNGDKYDFEYKEKSMGKIHAFFGNFSVLLRTYTYIRMLGAEGLKGVSENAIINANYLLARLRDDFVVPYDEKCMHECVLSGDRQKEIGVSTKDMAKRLMDYGFHAPTVYFPLIVHEAMLIEPTETESYESLNQFADAMISIAKEAVETPEKLTNAPLNAPVKRLDDAMAARNLNISWFNGK